MPEISFLDIKTGIIEKLNAIFPKLDTYGEEIKQGFEEPCFFVQNIEYLENKLFACRYERIHDFCVVYFPDSKLRKEKECFQIAETLCHELEYLKANNSLFRGSNIRFEYEDSRLHFFITYKCHVFKNKTTEEEFMKYLEQHYFEKEADVFGTRKSDKNH